MKTVQTLRGLGLAMYEIVAEQIAMVAHAYRGESREAQRCQQRVETLALQGGTTWQTDIFIPVNLLIAHYLAGDIVALKHARQQLLRRAAEVPSIAVFGRLAAALIQLSRGRCAEALETFEQLKDEFRPRERNGWASLPATMAAAYTGVGEPARARALCLETLAIIRPTDFEFPMAYVHVERELARAEAALGQHAEAAHRIDAMIQKYASEDAAMLLGLLHRDATLLALGRGDQGAAERHIERAREYFRTTTNDALIATAERLAARVSHKRKVVAPPSAEAKAQTTERVRTLLETADNPTRAQIALETIAQSTGAR
jgi:tetratricopeptide (TPR) repeat protein